MSDVAPSTGAAAAGTLPVPAVAAPPASANAPPVVSTEELDQLYDQLRQKDAQVLQLQKKLAHFRQWVTSVHAKVQQLNPQTLKNSRRLYIGGIPPDASEDDLRVFLNGLMMKTGALTSPGSAIVSCKITTEKAYAFVEYRSVEEASNAMALDGVAYRDTFLKIRRPSNYDIATAIMLGPVLPDPTMDTSQLDICKTVVDDSPNKLFVGGLPCDWTEDQVKELLLPLGALKSFNLVMDKTTGKSKGYAFCEYADEAVTEPTIRTLHGKRVGSKTLTVKRALEGSGRGPSGSGAASVSHSQGPVSRSSYGSGGGAPGMGGPGPHGGPGGQGGGQGYGPQGGSYVSPSQSNRGPPFNPQLMPHTPTRGPGAQQLSSEYNSPLEGPSGGGQGQGPSQQHGQQHGLPPPHPGYNAPNMSGMWG